MDELELTPEKTTDDIAYIIKGTLNEGNPEAAVDTDVVYTEDKEHGIAPTYTVSIDILYTVPKPHCTKEEFTEMFGDFVQNLRMVEAIVVRLQDVEKWHFSERLRADFSDGKIIDGGYCELTYTPGTGRWTQKMNGIVIPEPNVPDIDRILRS